MLLVKKDNPTLSPAINRTWIDSWGRAQVNGNLPHSPQRNQRAHDGGNQQSVRVETLRLSREIRTHWKPAFLEKYLIKTFNLGKKPGF
jgi:hypothetical protein